MNERNKPAPTTAEKLHMATPRPRIRNVMLGGHIAFVECVDHGITGLGFTAAEAYDDWAYWMLYVHSICVEPARGLAAAMHRERDAAFKRSPFGRVARLPPASGSRRAH